MLKGGNALTVGVGIIIEVIRKNNSDYDPEITAGQELPPSSGDPIYLGTLLRLFAKHVLDFTELILSPTHTVSNGDATMTITRKELPVAFGKSIEPLGFDRFKTCELMAELLHCSNMGLLNERGSEDYIRRRDQDRERLKAEGALNKHREPQSAVTEFSEDSTTFQAEPSSSKIIAGSPTDTRKLEVTNNADDDEFEDVGASGELSDEIKDDFDEKTAFELESNEAQAASPLKPSKSRVSLDDEFFDEPHHSPGLEAGDKEEAEGRSTPPRSEDQRPQPASPTVALTSDVKGLQIHGEQHDDESNNPQKIEKSSTADLVAEINSHLPSAVDESIAPPLPQRDRQLKVESVTKQCGSPGGLSPHAEDEPAPLFSPRPDDPSRQEESPLLDDNTSDQSYRQENDALTTQNAAHDQLTSTYENEQSFAVQIESDIDGQPIVGDYLKMMFVEHKVVPTILV